MARKHNRRRRCVMRQQLRESVEKRCGKLFETGDKYKYWSKEDFVCSDFNCSDRNCKNGMTANTEYGCKEMWFENGAQLGEGGFGKVFQFPFHKQDAAFKKIPIYFETDKDKAMDEAYQEFEIMRTISTKPKSGDDMLNQGSARVSARLPKDFFWKTRYEDEMEKLVISPLGCFYMEEISTGEVWMILILPKMKNHLNKIKREGRLDEANIKSIMAQLFKVMIYLKFVRDIRHQDVKPENILLDYEEENNKIANIKVHGLYLKYLLILFSD